VLLVCLVLLAPALPACLGPEPDDSESQRGAVLDVCATSPEGALCDDRNVCTTGDKCVSGVCTGVPAPAGMPCTDGNVCTGNDMCSNGTCAGTPIPDATPCTDGDPCTVGDQCVAARCIAGAGTLVCNDNVDCTIDMCIPAMGCVFLPAGDCLDGSVVPDVDAGADALSDSGVAPGSDAAVTDAGTTADALMTPDTRQTDAAAPVDMRGAADAGVTADAGAMSDAGIMTDAGSRSDAGSDGARDTRMTADAGAADGAGADGLPDGGDESDGAAPFDLHAHGGACACTTSDAPPGAEWGALALAAAWALGRRRSRPARPASAD
jgi:MYXO-CTERM domain-containing protein